ncbi:Autophagy protein 5 [Rhodotorula toruloides]|nr:Autophagy protein 5 [Rhodotorula toruloides]KAK4331258.1 Autophagy protein 5 [Rhodotorula toruloides]
MRQTPSNSSFTGSGGSGGTGAGDAGGAGALAAVFRTLVFGGNVPIQVVLAEDELPAQADRSIEVHYVQAPRTAYLPLLLPQIRKYFVNLVLDDNTAASLRDQDLCFKADGVPLKWHWPVGLFSTLLRPARFLQRNSPRTFRILTHRPPSNTLLSTLDTYLVLPPADPTQPWKITLHLRDPPSDVLVVSNKIEDARVGFMAMVKEADYVRSGNTKRVMNLRKEQQDGLWEGVV